jgi:hypothetical protein
MLVRLLKVLSFKLLRISSLFVCFCFVFLLLLCYPVLLWAVVPENKVDDDDDDNRVGICRSPDGD